MLFETGKMQHAFLESKSLLHAHKEAIMKWIHYTKLQSIVSQLTRQVRHDQAKAQTCLLKMIFLFQLIARQGLSSTGHDN